MIFDTDVLIWAQRGNSKAATLIESIEEREISVYSYMELLQGAQKKLHHSYIKSFLTEYEFVLLPLTEEIGHRALIYIEEYSLSDGLFAGDAIIAATCVERNKTLITSNLKHFKVIKDLKVVPFKP